MIERKILWTDASCYDGAPGGGVAGIAVVDHRTAIIMATQVLWGCRSCAVAELEAIRLAFRLSHYLHPHQVEVRSDCRSSVEALTAPSGVRLCLGYRGDNKAHKTARRVSQRARALAHSFYDQRDLHVGGADPLLEVSEVTLGFATREGGAARRQDRRERISETGP